MNKMLTHSLYVDVISMNKLHINCINTGEHASIKRYANIQTFTETFTEEPGGAACIGANRSRTENTRNANEAI